MRFDKAAINICRVPDEANLRLDPLRYGAHARASTTSRELARELAADVVHLVRAHVDTAAHDACALNGDERALAALTESVQQTASELQLRLGL